MSILDEIVERTRDEVRRRRRDVPEDELRSRLRPHGEGRPFAEALASQPGVSVIAEHKRRAPSAATPLREGTNLTEIVSAYERAGATALSVLTDGPFFGGALEDLAAARAASGLPILRKDFIVHRYQLYEAAAAGADAILLIVAALSPTELTALHAEAAEVGLSALTEVHDERELEIALEAGAEIIGINNRDLKTLEVDTRRTFDLLPRAAGRALVVSESGFSRPEQLEELADAGVDGVLVGEALMRSADVEAACRALTAR